MKARLLVMLTAIVSMVLAGGAWKHITPDG